jgi:hypothetical protein
MRSARGSLLTSVMTVKTQDSSVVSAANVRKVLPRAMKQRNILLQDSARGASFQPDLTLAHTCGITVIDGAALCVDDMHSRAASLAPFSSLLLRHPLRSLETLKKQARMGEARV